MSFIHRKIESKILIDSKNYPFIFITGPRQSGKTTVLTHLMDYRRTYVSLANLNDRQLAKKNPEGFFSEHKFPIFIDDIHYVPELFLYIEKTFLNTAKPGAFWFAGSSAFRTIELAKNSLGKELSVIHVPMLCQSEIYQCDSSPEESDNPLWNLYLKKNPQRLPATPGEVYKRIWEGSMPAFFTDDPADRKSFYNNYILSYIEHEVSQHISHVDTLLFYNFIRSVALHSASLLNIHDIAKEIDISDDTAKRWLKILESSNMIFYLHPYEQYFKDYKEFVPLKRMISKPKLYFFDTGLLAYLAGYNSPREMVANQFKKQMLETYVVSELRKENLNSKRKSAMSFLRNKDGKEIEVLSEDPYNITCIKIGTFREVPPETLKSFSITKKLPMPTEFIEKKVYCMCQEYVPGEISFIPIWMI